MKQYPLKQLFLFLFCTVLLSVASLNKARASHAMGADLSYECIDPVNRVYKITLRFYRDCAGIEEPASILLDVSSTTCGQALSLTLTQEACPPSTNGGKPCEVSPLCPGSILQSSCNGGTLPGVQAFTYSGTITLPMNCPDWTFSFSECCRNDQITNLVNASSEDLYIQATLNNSGGQQNNSPVFTTLPVPFICANQPFSYNQGALDADGDSIVYTLVNPLGAGATQISYNVGFSPTTPLTTTPPNSFGFSNTTGQISFQPNGVQVAVVTVLVQEYRNGVLIGTTMRDIQIVVLNIPGCGVPPTFTGAIQNTVQNGIYISPQLVQVCPGNALSFSVLAFNSTNDSVFIESNASVAMPGSQFVVNYMSKDSVFGYFTWIPTALDTGFNNLVVTVKNKNCPIASIQSYAVSVQVLAGTYAGPDLSYCPAGGPVQLQAYGGNQFTWSPTTGLSNPNVGNPLASPSQTTDYIVVSNLSSSCKNRDTVRVNVVPDFNFTVSQSDDTICRFEFVNFTATPDPTYAPYTYLWTPALGLNAVTISNPSAQPDYTTNYVVTIKASNGCVRKDTLKVVVEGQGPQVAITADRTKVCVGDTIHLTSKISALPCGLNVVPCQGTYNIKTVGTGNVQDVNGVTPYRGFYMDARMQILYRASELQALGMQPGTITDLAFDIAQQGSSAPYNGFTIRMGCTNLNSLSSFVSGLSTVYGPTNFTPSGTGFNTHALDNPYDWDGFSNIIIEICFDNNVYTNDDIVNATTTAYNSVLYAYQDNTVGCNLSLPNISTNRPNTQFIYCVEPPSNLTHTWTPTTNLFVPDSLNPFVVLNQTTTYYLNVNDGSCTGGGAITLNIDTSFGVTAGPDVSFCNGVPAQLNGAVTGIPPTGGSSSCGVNGTPCSGAPVQKTFTPSGASSSSITPFAGGFFLALEDQRTQILYRASDLLAAGIPSGTINQLGLNITSKASTFPYQNFSIKLGCTNKTELTAGTWEPTTTVYTNLLYPTVAGWNDFTFTNTFDWDGNSNIVVEICWDNPDNFPSTGLDAVSAGTPNYNSFQTVTGVLSVGCNMSASAASVAQVLPEIRLRICGSQTLPVTYTWSPSAGLSSDSVPKPYATPETQTTYVLTAYFGGKCPKTDTVVVTPQTFPYNVTPDTALCEGSSVQLSVTGGSAYAWTPATGLSCTNCANPVASPPANTVYYLTITDTATGCIVKDTVALSVFNLSADAWFGDTLVDQGTPITLGANVTGNSTVGYTYQWTPSEYLDNATSATPFSTPLSDVLYLLTVNAGGCTDTTQVNVRVNIVASPVVMPNAFTPNGDGKNDDFYPVILNPLAKVKTFRVYNRYGAMIHDGNTPWDGRFKGADQPTGTYVYYIVIERPLQKDEPLQGSFTLLR
jgi:gliding motility-associated-like protein